MGYGTLDEIPTAYALKYMTLDTFTTLVTYGAELPLGWPKRFVEGFQRLWERVAWGLEVRCNVQVQSVRRGATIQIQFTEQEQILDQSDLQAKTLEVDYLILACPLTEDVLTPFLDRSETETNLFRQIQLNPYSLTTYQIPDFKMPTPVTNVIPMNPVGNPGLLANSFWTTTWWRFTRACLGMRTRWIGQTTQPAKPGSRKRFKGFELPCKTWVRLYLISTIPTMNDPIFPTSPLR